MFFGLFYFFVCQSWRIASLPFDATSSHAFACYCVKQKKDYIHYKLFIVFKEMCYWTALHAGHVRFFSFFLCLKMSFLSDDSSMAFILHLWPPHFFGTATKKWQDFPPLVIYTTAFQLCWSAPPSAVIRLQWMRYAFLMEVDRRGSWCEGGNEKTSLLRKSPIPFLEV